MTEKRPCRLCGELLEDTFEGRFAHAVEKHPDHWATKQMLKTAEKHPQAYARASGNDPAIAKMSRMLGTVEPITGEEEGMLREMVEWDVIHGQATRDMAESDARDTRDALLKLTGRFRRKARRKLARLIEKEIHRKGNGHGKA